MIVTFTAPLPPSTNELRRPGRTRDGKTRLFSTPRAMSYKDALAALLLGSLAERGIGHPLWCSDHVALRIDVYFDPQHRNSDLSNRIKLLEDALSKLLYSDDSQVTVLLCHKWPSPRNYVSVTITGADEWHQLLAGPGITPFGPMPAFSSASSPTSPPQSPTTSNSSASPASLPATSRLLCLTSSALDAWCSSMAITSSKRNTTSGKRASPARTKTSRPALASSPTPRSSAPGQS